MTEKSVPSPEQLVSKLLTELRAARTRWHEDFGVPISEEYAEFLRAIGNAEDFMAAHCPRKEEVPTPDPIEIGKLGALYGEALRATEAALDVEIEDWREQLRFGLEKLRECFNATSEYTASLDHAQFNRMAPDTQELIKYAHHVWKDECTFTFFELERGLAAQAPLPQAQANFVSDQNHPGPSCSKCGAAMILVYQCLSCGDSSVLREAGTLTELKELLDDLVHELDDSGVCVMKNCGCSTSKPIARMNEILKALADSSALTKEK